MTNFIVSLTSHPERFSSLEITLAALAKQTLLPEKVILNLAFGTANLLPDTILKMEFPVGLEIYETQELGPGTKIIPTLARYPNEIIVTVDDDHVYDARLFETLWSYHLANPQDVIIGLGHSVKFIGNQLASSVYWDHRSDYFETELLFNTGAYGALFPPKSLHPETTDASLYRELSFSSVSPWLWINLLRQETRIRQIPPGLSFHLLEGSQGVALSTNGNVEVMWDYNLKKMWTKFGMDDQIQTYIGKFGFDLTNQQADLTRPAKYPLFSKFEVGITIPNLDTDDMLIYLDLLPPEKRFPFVKEFRKYLENSVNLLNKLVVADLDSASERELNSIKNSRIWRYTKFWRDLREFLS